MPDEKTRFQTLGLSWSERAALGGLRAVLSPSSSSKRNNFIHGVHSYGASQAYNLASLNSLLVDFGCGTGRFSQYFASRKIKVIGTEITFEMLTEAQRVCEELDCLFALTNGITLPLADNSVNLVWCCAVLRYSLFVPDPVYEQIAAEMYRVLKPGGYVVNVEMYVDKGPSIFIEGFERVGFITRKVRVLQRYEGFVERLLMHNILPDIGMRVTGKVLAALRSYFDNPFRETTGLRDYLFVWNKAVN